MGTYITGDGFVAYSAPARSGVGTTLTNPDPPHTHPAAITMGPIAKHAGNPSPDQPNDAQENPSCP
jgi:hypothetical protein